MSSPKKYRIGTRKSALAKTQSGFIRDQLEAQGLACELVEIVSEGDRDRTTPLYSIESQGPGLFTKQLEIALLEKRIDLAVHSLKDLPTQQPPELFVVAVPPRENSEDSLLIHPTRYDARQPLGLPRGAKVGTSSLRREAQLLAQRPDLEILPLRGNVPTRLDAAKTGKLDAVVLAEAGLRRLGLDLEGVKKVVLPREQFVSAPAQGALGLEARRNESGFALECLRNLHDDVAGLETKIERRILRELEGGCTLPLGVRVEVGTKLKVWAFLGIAKDRGTGQHDWVSFHPFETSEDDEEVLVQRTVDHFRGRLKAGHP